MIVDLGIAFEGLSKDKEILREGNVEYLTDSNVDMFDVNSGSDGVGAEAIIVPDLDETSANHIFLVMPPVEGLQVVVELTLIVPDELILVDLFFCGGVLERAEEAVVLVKVGAIGDVVPTRRLESWSHNFGLLLIAHI
jgi:hypothetical protein